MLICGLQFSSLLLKSSIIPMFPFSNLGKEELNNCNCFFFVSWISIVEMYTTQTSLYFKRYVLNLCNYF